MEVLVQRNSPLGQYLAELDNESTVKEDCRSINFRANCAANSRLIIAAYINQILDIYNHIWRTISRRVYLLTMKYLMSKLPLEVVDISEEWDDLNREIWIESKYNLNVSLFRNILYLFMQCRQANNASRISYVYNNNYAVAIGVFGVVLALLASRYLYAAAGVLCGCAVIIFLGLELYDILLRQWCLHLATKLVRDYEDLQINRQKFTTVFHSCLRNIKESEAVMRGYSLSFDGWLPPVSANEGNHGKRLQSIKLREKLSAINIHLHQIINNLSERKVSSTPRVKLSNILQSNSLSNGVVPPSLLLSALKQTHNRLLVMGDGKINSLLNKTIFQWNTCKNKYKYPISLQQAISHHKNVVSNYKNELLILSDHLLAFLENPYNYTQISDKNNHIKPMESQTTSPNSHVPVQLCDLRSAVSTLKALTLAHEDLWLHSHSDSMDGDSYCLHYEWKTNDLLLLQKHLAYIQRIGKNYEECIRKKLMREVNILDPSPELIQSGTMNTGKIVKKSNETSVSTAGPPASNTSKKTVVFSAVSQGEESFFDIQQLLKNGRDQSAIQGSKFGSKLGFLHELKTVLQHREVVDEIESDYNVLEEKESESHNYKRPILKVRNRQTRELQFQSPPPILIPVPTLQLKNNLDSHIQTQLHTQQLEDTFSDSESDSN